MPFSNSQKLYDNLKELNIIDSTALDESLRQSQEMQQSLGDILLERSLITDENLAKFIGDMDQIPYINLASVVILPEVLHIIPEIVARKQKVIAFKKDEQGVHLAMIDPHNIQVKDFIQKKIGIPITVYITTEAQLSNTLSLYSKGIVQTFDEIISENIQLAKGARKSDPPIIKIVDTILFYAHQNKASDIHIEPHEDKSSVRFRIDGILHNIVNLPLDIHQQIVTRIKVMSKLRTDEHQSAQDGKLQYDIDKQRVDVRVSIVPITKGEKVVMRLLSEKSRQLSLTDLGITDEDLKKVQTAYKKPYGMILATGPTGSGKTTSMYAILKLLNHPTVNIATIEDPVEYDLEGVSQIQVNVKTNLTFASGLRSILRQDPNIILVGEIRDEETAGIAINAAMTGHLVLSTLHTNDASTTIPRLFDMGIEPFLVASTVNVIVAQRLVRRIHFPCRISEEIDLVEIAKHVGPELIKKAFGESKTARLYRGKGCQLCQNTGYESRIGVFEVMTIDDELRQAIVGRKDAATIYKIARTSGMRTMIEDGLEKVKQGLTTIEEVVRVTKE